MIFNKFQKNLDKDDQEFFEKLDQYINNECSVTINFRDGIPAETIAYLLSEGLKFNTIIKCDKKKPAEETQNLLKTLRNQYPESFKTI